MSYEIHCSFWDYSNNPFLGIIYPIIFNVQGCSTIGLVESQGEIIIQNISNKDTKTIELTDPSACGFEIGRLHPGKYNSFLLEDPYTKLSRIQILGEFEFTKTAFDMYANKSPNNTTLQQFGPQYAYYYDYRGDLTNQTEIIVEIYSFETDHYTNMTAQIADILPQPYMAMNSTDLIRTDYFIEISGGHIILLFRQIHQDLVNNVMVDSVYYIFSSLSNTTVTIADDIPIADMLVDPRTDMMILMNSTDNLLLDFENNTTKVIDLQNQTDFSHWQLFGSKLYGLQMNNIIEFDTINNSSEVYSIDVQDFVVLDKYIVGGISSSVPSTSNFHVFTVLGGIIGILIIFHFRKKRKMT